MEGQLSVWDFEGAPGMYHYKFKRYLGQPVGFWRTGHCGVIVKIEKYYTEVLTDEGIMVGTPYDLTDEVEYDFPCDECAHDIKGCCDYNEPLGRTCVLGSGFRKKVQHGNT